MFNNLKPGPLEPTSAFQASKVLLPSQVLRTSKQVEATATELLAGCTWTFKGRFDFLQQPPSDAKGESVENTMGKSIDVDDCAAIDNKGEDVSMCTCNQHRRPTPWNGLGSPRKSRWSSVDGRWRLAKTAS
jgi:hypothetical protein